MFHSDKKKYQKRKINLWTNINTKLIVTNLDFKKYLYKCISLCNIIVSKYKICNIYVDNYHSRIIDDISYVYVFSAQIKK